MSTTTLTQTTDTLLLPGGMVLDADPADLADVAAELEETICSSPYEFAAWAVSDGAGRVLTTPSGVLVEVDGERVYATTPTGQAVVQVDGIDTDGSLIGPEELAMVIEALS